MVEETKYDKEKCWEVFKEVFMEDVNSGIAEEGQKPEEYKPWFNEIFGMMKNGLQEAASFEHMALTRGYAYRIQKKLGCYTMEDA